MADSFAKDMQKLKKMVKATRVFSPAGVASMAADVMIDLSYQQAVRRIERDGISPASVKEADRIFKLKAMQDKLAGIKTRG